MKLSFILLSIMFFLTACTPAVKKNQLVVEIDQPIVIEPIKKIEVEVEREIEILPLPKEKPDVLLLLSSSAKTYQRLAAKLKPALGKGSQQIILTGQRLHDVAKIKDIKENQSQQIIALGLNAVNLVKNLPDKKIIFAQVIMPYGLTTDNIKGVSALPSPEKLFKDWKILSPRLSKVAIIVGKDLDDYLDRAKAAAEKENIELVIQQVRTDKEFIYKSKHLKADVDGQWILPDNRVLSGVALKEVMSYGSRRGRQLVVFSPKLLSFGGFFYVVPDIDAIAKGVLQRLSAAANKEQIADNSILPIFNHTMGINQNIARQLNLSIPQEYREYINGQ